MQKNILIGAGVVVLALVAGLTWFIFSSANGSPQAGISGTFGSGDTVTPVTPPDGDTGNIPQYPANSGTPGGTQSIFKISNGPVGGATLLQTGHPTTTVARFIMQDSGHVADIIIDSRGAVSTPVSNTTIPGITTSAWTPQGTATVLQYMSADTIKTVSLMFPTGTSTLSRAVSIKFFPDGIVSVTLSPDGALVAYLLKTSAGTDGYVAKIDGSGSKKLFSLPLAQVRLSWPAQGTLLAQSKAAAGVPGIIFSVDAKSGAVNPLLYASGITANANALFSYVMYQSIEDGSQKSYLRTVRTGANIPLSFGPIPEKCAWGYGTAVAYCAAPLSRPWEYLDAWYSGVSSLSDSILRVDAATGSVDVVQVPGSPDGGVQSDILSLSVSPDDKYLLFIKKGDRSLWGVRL